MEKVLNIGGKEVKMKSTASLLSIYRNTFGRDFMSDIIKMQGSLNNVEKGKELEAIDLDFFEKVAWCMAKAGDSETPEFEKWLDEFELFDLLQALPEIMGLITANMEQINLKKN